MSLSRLGDYLDQMLTAANDARRFIDGMSKEDFLADKRTQQAVVMSLVIIGEAAARIMDKHSQFVADNSEIPWRGIRGMRNRVTTDISTSTSMSYGTPLKPLFRICCCIWSVFVGEPSATMINEPAAGNVQVTEAPSGP
jgi:uncharacterized protein with HEPN domain